jgi:transposase-like protein
MGLEGFDEKILAMYARGMTTRAIQVQMQELNGVEVSPTLISNVTETVMEEVQQWHTCTPHNQFSPNLSIKLRNVGGC